jgi:hypothetical protein
MTVARSRTAKKYPSRKERTRKVQSGKEQCRTESTEQTAQNRIVPYKIDSTD